MTETKYLLPCECGEAVPIESRQAGQSVSCDCGRTMDVPTMRAVRQLTPYEPPAPARRARRDWNPLAGVVFAVGALIACFGLGVASFGYNQVAARDLPPPPQETIEKWVSETDEASPEQLWETWNGTVEHGLGTYRASPWVIAREQSKLFWKVCLAGLAAVVCGVAVASSALLLRPRKNDAAA